MLPLEQNAYLPIWDWFETLIPCCLHPKSYGVPLPRSKVIGTIRFHHFIALPICLVAKSIQLEKTRCHSDMWRKTWSVIYKRLASNVWPSLFFILTPLEFGTLFLWAASGASGELLESGVMIEATRIPDWFISYIYIHIISTSGILKEILSKQTSVLHSNTAMYCQFHFNHFPSAK